MGSPKPPFGTCREFVHTDDRSRSKPSTSKTSKAKASPHDAPATTEVKSPVPQASLPSGSVSSTNPNDTPTPPPRNKGVLAKRWHSEAVAAIMSFATSPVMWCVTRANPVNATYAGRENAGAKNLKGRVPELLDHVSSAMDMVQHTSHSRLGNLRSRSDSNITYLPTALRPTKACEVMQCTIDASTGVPTITGTRCLNAVVVSVY